jgi:hypothetical protein
MAWGFQQPGGRQSYKKTSEVIGHGGNKNGRLNLPLFWKADFISRN